MRRILTILSLVASLLLTVPAIAAPSNDDLANARQIASLPFSHALNNSSATMEPDEPAFCNMTASVWYRWTAPSGQRLTIDLEGSSTYSAVAIFVGSGYDDLSLIECSWGSAVLLDPTPGTSYLIQVGAQSWSTPGSLNLNIDHVGAITGVVTDSTGGPLDGICVVALDEDYRSSSARTGPDGRYKIVDLKMGGYRMNFYPCDYWASRYEGEWYNDKRDAASADVVLLQTPELPVSVSLAEIQPARAAWADIWGIWGCDDLWAEVSMYNMNNVTAGPRVFDLYLDGVKVATEELAPGVSVTRSVQVPDDLAFHAIIVRSDGVVLDEDRVRVRRCGDYALVDLKVEPVRLKHDEAELVSPGYSRLISFAVDNLIADSGEGDNVSVDIRVCPVSQEGCTLIKTINLGGVDGLERGSFQWNALGYVGDVEIRAELWGYFNDRTGSNNSRAVNHHVIVGGSGLGVGPRL